jgi:hypothetical protein
LNHYFTSEANIQDEAKALNDVSNFYSDRFNDLKIMLVKKEEYKN